MAFVTHAFAFIVRMFIPVLSCVCVLSSVCFHVCALICVLSYVFFQMVCSHIHAFPCVPSDMCVAYVCFYVSDIIICMLSYVFSAMCARRSLSAHILYLYTVWGLLTG